LRNGEVVREEADAWVKDIWRGQKRGDCLPNFLTKRNFGSLSQQAEGEGGSLRGANRKEKRQSGQTHKI